MFFHCKNSKFCFLVFFFNVDNFATPEKSKNHWFGALETANGIDGPNGAHGAYLYATTGEKRSAIANIEKNYPIENYLVYKTVQISIQ